MISTTRRLGPLFTWYAWGPRWFTHRVQYRQPTDFVRETTVGSLRQQYVSWKLASVSLTYRISSLPDVVESGFTPCLWAIAMSETSSNLVVQYCWTTSVACIARTPYAPPRWRPPDAGARYLNDRIRRLGRSQRGHSPLQDQRRGRSPSRHPGGHGHVADTRQWGGHTAW